MEELKCVAAKYFGENSERETLVENNVEKMTKQDNADIMVIKKDFQTPSDVSSELENSQNYSNLNSSNYQMEKTMPSEGNETQVQMSKENQIIQDNEPNSSQNIDSKPTEKESLKQNNQMSEDNIEINKLKSSAEIFGLTTRELENEFIDYKIDKLLKRLDFLIDKSVSEPELREKIYSARRNGFGSITVLPPFVGVSQKYIAEKKIDVQALMSYPYGEEFSKTKIISAKLLAKTQIASVLIPLNQTMFSYTRLKTTEKDIKKIVRTLKNKMLKPIVNLEDWSQQGLVSLVKLCLDKDVQTICVWAEENSIMKLKSLIALCGNRIKVECIGCPSLKLAVSFLNLGVNRISAKNVEKLADELVAKLKD